MTKPRLRTAIRSMLSTKEDYQELFPGNLGALVKGKKRIKVPGRDGFVYVRLRSTNSEIVQAFNDKVAYIYGLDVVVARDKWANKRYVVVSRDLGRYDEWGGGVSVGQLAPHGYQHSFGKDDPVWVYKQQFMPLLVSPLTTTSVKISSDYYIWEGAYKFYSGSSVDLSANIPIVVGYSKFVTLYLDGTTNSVQQVVGTDFLSTGYTGDIASYIPTISSDQGIALGAVVLNFGQSQITWRNIYDIRPLWTGKAIQYPPGSLYIYDDGVLKGTGTSIDFAYGLDVTMVGSRAYVDSSNNSIYFRQILLGDHVTGQGSDGEIYTLGLSAYGTGSSVQAVNIPADCGMTRAILFYCWDKSQYVRSIYQGIISVRINAWRTTADETSIGAINVYLVKLGGFDPATNVYTTETYLANGSFPDLPSTKSILTANIIMPADYPLTSSEVFALYFDAMACSFMGWGTPVTVYMEWNSTDSVTSVSWPTGPLGSGLPGHQITNNGAISAQRNKLNFIPGGGITLISGDDSVNDRTNITISGSSDGHTIRDDGVLQTSRPSLDFVGTGFSVYDSPSATIVSGTSAAIVQGDMTATSPIAVDQTRQVIGGAVVLSHVTTPGNIHLPSGGSAGQYLGYGGSSGVGTWTDLSSTGTVASVPAASVQIQGALATGTSAGAYIAPTTGTITACYIYCKTKGSANNTIVDVHKNGTTIFTNQANRPSLAWNDGDGVAKSGVPDVVALVENDLLTFFIDAIATGAEDLTIVLAVDWVSARNFISNDTIWDAKGDLAVGTGADTAQRLPVGSSGQWLTPATGTVTGLQWANNQWANNDGWIPVESVWIHSTGTAITVPSGATGTYSVGDKIRFKQGGDYKYMYVVGVTDILLTVTGGSDYSVTNATITNNYYSKIQTPVEFPGDFVYAPTITNSVGTYTATTINARFRINGRSVFLFMFITVNNKGTATGNPIATLPISAIYSNLFICYGRENALEGKMLQGHISTPTTMTIFDYANAPPNNNNGAVYIVNVTYMI